MRARGPLAAIAASPTMVGAITTLVAIVAVFLAYNANNGLPFVPVYRVSVDVPNASRVLHNNEVRIGGRRVGIVESVEPVPAAAGDGAGERTGPAPGVSEVSPVGARLNLKLDQVAKPLPRDSEFRIRYRSAFGLKYLEVVRGSGTPAPEGFVFADSDAARDDPAPDTAEIVDQTEFDEIYNTFDSDTRSAIRTNLGEFGSAFAGRGQSVNRAVEVASPLFELLVPVAGTLAADRTRLDRFFEELADFSRVVATRSVSQAEFFAAAARVFAALTRERGALEQSITEGPPTLETGVATLPGQRRLLTKVATLARELLPGARRLAGASEAFNDAAELGTPVLARVPGLEQKLVDSFEELQSLLEQPTTRAALERIGPLLDDLAPIAEYVVPAQTVCNYWNYFWTFVPGTIADDDQVGWNVRQRAVVPPFGNTVLPGPDGAHVTIYGEAVNSVGNYAGKPAAGLTGALSPEGPGVFDPYRIPIQHGNPYGPTGQDGSDCQAGQVGYVLGNLQVAGQPPESPSFIASDIPGDRGPTTLFFNEDGERELRDTRVEARQP